jgi:CubicO group peptidase (beta-lactamase class C family)
MTPRDLARFGHVFLQDGNAEGTPVIPSSWVDYSTSELVPSSSIDLCRSYGAWWWRKSYGGYQVLYALGWGGQYILNVPDLNLTVVLTSRWDIGNAPDHIPALFDLFENYLLPAIL